MKEKDRGGGACDKVGGAFDSVGGAYMPKGIPGELGVEGGACKFGAEMYLGGPKVQQVLKGLSQGAQLLFQAAVCVPHPLSLLRSQKGGDTELASRPT